MTWLRRLGPFGYKTTRARIIAYLRENPGWRGLVEIDEGARLGILSPILVTVYKMANVGDLEHQRVDDGDAIRYRYRLTRSVSEQV